MNNKNAGYTITELLVAMLIGSLIVGFCFSAYVFSQRMYFLWIKKNDVEYSTHGLFQVIALDIERAKRMEIYPDSLSLHLIGNREVVYRFNGESLWRNDVEMNETGQEVMLELKKHEERIEMVVTTTIGERMYSVSGTATGLRSSQGQFESSF